MAETNIKDAPCALAGDLAAHLVSAQRRQCHEKAVFVAVGSLWLPISVATFWLSLLGGHFLALTFVCLSVAPGSGIAHILAAFAKYNFALPLGGGRG